MLRFSGGSSSSDEFGIIILSFKKLELKRGLRDDELRTWYGIIGGSGHDSYRFT